MFCTKGFKVRIGRWGQFRIKRSIRDGKHKVALAHFPLEREAYIIALFFIIYLNKSLSAMWESYTRPRVGIFGPTVDSYRGPTSSHRTTLPLQFTISNENVRAIYYFVLKYAISSALYMVLNVSRALSPPRMILKREEVKYVNKHVHQPFKMANEDRKISFRDSFSLKVHRRDQYSHQMWTLLIAILSCSAVWIFISWKPLLGVSMCWTRINRIPRLSK